MYIYEITQTVNQGYDTYDSAIVVANDRTEAAHTHPDGDKQWDITKQKWGFVTISGRTILDMDSHTWSNPSDVVVTLIGEANEDIEAGVVLASFNAG